MGILFELKEPLIQDIFRRTVFLIVGLFSLALLQSTITGIMNLFLNKLALAEVNTDILWEISTSSRTPRETVDALSELNLPNIQYTSFEDRSKDWLSGRLKIASRVWVTQDNLSTIYEGITAGSEVGVIRLKEKIKAVLIAQNIQQPIQDSLIVTQFELEQVII